MEVAVWSVATVAATNTAICGDIRDVSSRRVSGSIIVAPLRACGLRRSCSVAVSRMCCPMLNSHLVMRCFARRTVRKRRRRDEESCSRKCDDYFLHLVSFPEPRAVPICFHGPWNNHPKPLPLFRVSVRSFDCFHPEIVSCVVPTPRLDHLCRLRQQLPLALDAQRLSAAADRRGHRLGCVASNCRLADIAHA